MGHETDFSISDFVADMRAPTPSAAAEIAVPDIRELFERVDTYSERLSSALIRSVEKKRERLNSYMDRSVIVNPFSIIEENGAMIEDMGKRLNLAIKNVLKDARATMLLHTEKINSLNPLNVLARGCTIAEKDGKTIRNASSVETGDNIELKFCDGTVFAEAKNVRKI